MLTNLFDLGSCGVLVVKCLCVWRVLPTAPCLSGDVDVVVVAVAVAVVAAVDEGQTCSASLPPERA